MISIFRTALPIITLIASIQAHSTETEIPRSVHGDKSRYFLMDQKSKNGITSTLHRRDGPSGTGYTKAEIDCKNNRMRDIAYADEDINKMTHNPSKWYGLVEGSSKSDLFHFICKK